MYTIARCLQIVGLTIPLFAIMAQLQGTISAGNMLAFLVAALCVFYIGRILQPGEG